MSEPTAEGNASAAATSCRSLSSPASASTLTHIVNNNSGKCLTIAGGGTADNIYANQYDCDSHPSRLWKLPY